jgi:hypothetical protein
MRVSGFQDITRCFQFDLAEVLDLKFCLADYRRAEGENENSEQSCSRDPHESSCASFGLPLVRDLSAWDAAQAKRNRILDPQPRNP